MSVLLVDIGNTRIKYLLPSNADSQTEFVPRESLAGYSWPTGISKVLVASVQDDQKLHSYFEQAFGDRLVWLAHPLTHSHTRSIGFKHCYADPKRLGVDRWLAMLGASQSQTEGAIVVDAGTALTIDLLSSDKEHLGGYIVPGLEMSRTALFRGTGKVVAFGDEQEEQGIQPGQDTLNSVAAGTFRQQLALIESVKKEYPEYKLFVTGGDGEKLAEALGVSYQPDLVFDGMNLICD